MTEGTKKMVQGTARAESKRMGGTRPKGTNDLLKSINMAVQLLGVRRKGERKDTGTGHR